MKFEKNLRITILLVIVSLVWLAPIPIMSRGFLPPKTSAPSYSWQETTYDYSLNRVWDGISSVINYSNTFDDVFITSTGYSNGTDIWIRETRTHYAKANYSFFSNTTMKGYINLNMSLELFQVNIDYGTAVDMIWMALKKGDLQMEYFLEQYENDYSYFEEYYADVESEFVKINTTSKTIVDTWTETSNTTGELNMTVDKDLAPYNLLRTFDVEFSFPLILILQIYTTKHKDKIAWAEMIYDFIIYNDTDGDTIYSAGETSNPTSSGFNIYTSDEYRGSVQPHAWDIKFYQEAYYPSYYNITSHYKAPFDKTVGEIASTVQFTPPTNSTDNVISWGVEYPQFPIDARVNDNAGGPDLYSTPINATYAEMSPGDFNYQFDYNLSESQADLDFTLSTPKISNNSFYNAVQGYGLCLPHYNFFVTSFDIEEVDQIDLTMPSDLFTFASNGTTVAEVNMLNPVKKNYTLYDFPKVGTNTEMESMGGSLHALLRADKAGSGSSNDPFLNLIYTIKDIVDADPTFTIVDELYHMETQNYPVWSGEKLVHDPTLTIYYDPQVEEVQEPPIIPDPDPTLIPGFNTALVVAISTVVFVIKVAKIKKNKKKS